VTIPSSVTSIGANAFAADALTSVTIPSTVTSIGPSAFASDALTSVTIPSSVTSIGSQAFYDEGEYDPGHTLTSLTFATPSSVTSIGDFAFSYNELTSVTIPSSVTSIGEYAFYGNPLTSVTFLSSAPSFGTGVFTGSAGPAYYHPDTSWTSTVLSSLAPLTPTPLSPADGFTFTVNGGDVTITGCSPSTCPATLIIPSSIGGDPVTEIGVSAFYNAGLTSVTIPSSVTSIDNGAFYGNPLTSVTFLGSAPSFGTGVFTGSAGDVYYHPDTSWTSTVLSSLAPLTPTPLAPSSPADGFTFTVNGGDVTITGCSPFTCPATLIIPSSIGGDPVTEIGDYAFNNASPSLR
jgi:hypothetical protein